MMHPKIRRQGRIDLAKQVGKEVIEGEALPVENVETPLVPEPIDDALRVLPGGPALLLDLDQEPLQLVHGHDPVLGVPLEEVLDIPGHRRRRDLETPAAAEAHSVRLSRHGFAHARHHERTKKHDRATRDLSKRRKQGPSRTRERWAGARVRM